MGPQPVVEAEIVFQFPLGPQDAGVGLRYTSLYFTVRHSRSTKMLSWYRPLPSMLIFTPRSCSIWVNSQLVNWLP